MRRNRIGRIALAVFAAGVIAGMPERHGGGRPAGKRAVAGEHEQP